MGCFFDRVIRVIPSLGLLLFALHTFTPSPDYHRHDLQQL